MQYKWKITPKKHEGACYTGKVSKDPVFLDTAGQLLSGDICTVCPLPLREPRKAGERYVALGWSPCFSTLQENKIEGRKTVVLGLELQVRTPCYSLWVGRKPHR